MKNYNMKKATLKQLEDLCKQQQTEIARLQEENHHLLSRNLEISERLNVWYEVRREAELMKELFQADKRRTAYADLDNDRDLLALFELRIESGQYHLKADFDADKMADMLGVSTKRLQRLFRESTLHKSAEDYINFRRVMSAMDMIRSKPHYSIVAIAEEVGFGSVRTLQRNIQMAIGMTLAEYRQLCSIKAGLDDDDATLQKEK